ncbi:uncharacterized protein [Parasteatoda tepidariorum]|uniref:uncharacterized protein isoform X2 n=1 Tax=Parasteatoda tepidariorum TaxID=114398 RepID=UPI001C722630|nr:uncharacterized protein LOC107436169 isoform X2 [Parasteatoda tepidariorum]
MANSLEEKITNSVGAILKSLECAICLEFIKNPVSVGCGHFFCRFCITKTLQSEYQRPCPLCKKPFTRRIQKSIQRQKVINAAKKFAEVCGKAFGRNSFPKENTQRESQKKSPELRDVIGPELHIVLEDIMKSKKRKSEEIMLSKEPGESENGIPLKKLRNQEVSSSAGEAIPLATKRYCPAISDNDDSNELPSLEIFFTADRQQTNIYSDSKDKVDVENMPLLLADIETDKKSKEKKLVIRRKTKKSISRNQDKVILKNQKNLLALKNKTNNANDFERESREVVNPKLTDKMEIFCENDELSKENEKDFETSSNKCKPNFKKKPHKSGLCVSNSSAEEDLISEIKEAENHALVIEKNKDNYVDENVSQECQELAEIEIPSRVTMQPQESYIDAHPKNSKIDDISDTVVSVHSFASPQMNKGNVASKSPGWSRVKKVGKDFKVKKFSRLSVQRNSSACPVNEISNGDEKSCETFDKQPECNEISETVPTAEDLSQRSSPSKVMSDLNKNRVLDNEILVDYEIQSLKDMRKSMDEDEPMLEVPDTNEKNAFKDGVNQMSREKLILNVEGNKNTSEAQPNKFVDSCKSVDCILQAADDDIPSNEGVRDEMNQGINLQKKTDLIEEPMDTGFQVPDKDILEANLYHPCSLPICLETAKERSSISGNNLVNTELNCERSDNICKTPIRGFIKESRVSKIGKFSKGNSSPESDVFYVEHSQQTSQRIDFYDAKNHNESLVPALPVQVPCCRTETFTSNAIFPHPKSISWFCSKENATSEKTKVVKRTCLTLEEIQDYFTKSTISGKSETVCSLPFLSDSYKLHICVADDTLNVSVLKVVDSNTSEMHCTNLINIPEMSDLHRKTNPALMSKESFETLTDKFQNYSPAVLPSSNVESDCSEADDNSEAAKRKSNPFPFLSKFFSDSESTPQLNEATDSCNLNCVPDTYNVKDIRSMSVVKDLEEPKVKHVSIVKDVSDFSNVTTKDNTEIILPPSRKTSYKFPVQIEETPVNMETNSKKSFDSDSNYLKDSVNILINSKASSEKNQNSISVSEKKVEIIDTSQDSMDQDEDCSILKNTLPIGATTVYQHKVLNSDSSEELYKKALRDDDVDFLSELSDLNPGQTASHYASLMKEYDALSSDPVMAFADDLVAPLRNIADKLNPVSHESNKKQNKLTADPNELNQIDGTTSPLDRVLNLLPNKKSLFSNTNTKKKVSRLSLKKKKSSKFKRIQNDPDSSDSDEPESSEVDEVAILKSSKPTSPKCKNVSAASCNEQSTLDGSLSEDDNPSQIVKEIEDIDQAIRLVEEKLKMCGHGNLLSEENKILLKDMHGEECSNHEDSDDSDDIFSQSIPPTPPETIGNSKGSTLKKSRINY